MSKLTLDAAMPEKLRAATEPVEICNDAGTQLGVYYPTDHEKLKRVVAYLKTKITSEELDRREAEPGPGRSWDAIKKEMGIP